MNPKNLRMITEHHANICSMLYIPNGFLRQEARREEE